jgi:hypothetical protein
MFRELNPEQGKKVNLLEHFILVKYSLLSSWAQDYYAASQLKN